MIAPLDDVTARALSLSVDERARLAERLLASLDVDQEAVDAAWRTEIRRRMAEIADGTVTLRPRAEVMAAARARLRAATSQR
jgi:putative addiction module component (TIGR02574 family)